MRPERRTSTLLGPVARARVEEAGMPTSLAAVLAAAVAVPSTAVARALTERPTAAWRYGGDGDCKAEPSQVDRGRRRRRPRQGRVPGRDRPDRPHEARRARPVRAPTSTPSRTRPPSNSAPRSSPVSLPAHVRGHPGPPGQRREPSPAVDRPQRPAGLPRRHFGHDRCRLRGLDQQALRKRQQPSSRPPSPAAPTCRTGPGPTTQITQRITREKKRS